MKPMLYPDWKAMVVYPAHGAEPHTLVETGTFKGLVAGLEAGQNIPPHPEAFALYHFLEGTGWMTVDGERFAVAPGATVIAPAGAARGIEAVTRLAFLATRAT